MFLQQSAKEGQPQRWYNNQRTKRERNASYFAYRPDTIPHIGEQDARLL